MRLTEQARAALKQAIEPLVANATEVRVFGSRIDDTALGGDVDLFVEFAGKVDHPAALSAQIAVRASRALDGRSVDVILCAPNLKLFAIHQIAKKEGVLL